MRWRAIQRRRASCGRTTGDGSPIPRYAYPSKLSLSIAGSVLLGKRRTFSADASQLIRNLVPEPCVESASLIPPRDGFIVVTNHYYRPGYHVWWGIALISVAIAQFRSSPSEIAWLMTNRWTYQDAPRSRSLTPLTRLVFSRLARTYSFVLTPPMPPQPQYAEEGARSVRQILSLLDSSINTVEPIIGLAPEGRDSPDGSLVEPPSGTGRFLLHMTRRGLDVLPVGVAEVNGILTARFGPPFALSLRPQLNKKEQDRLASAEVMTAVGAQLPRELWGTFRAPIERLLGEP